MSRGRGMMRLSLDQFAELPRSREGHVEVDAHKPIRESLILSAAVDMLRAHPLVLWAERVNKGFGRLQRADGSLSPPYKWAYESALDITGGMVGGYRLEVETKRRGEKPSDKQQGIIDGLAMAGACAFWIDDVAQIFPAIQAWNERREARR